MEDYQALERKHHELQHEQCAHMQATVAAGVRMTASMTALAVETNDRVGRLERVTSERADMVDRGVSKLGERIDRLERTTNERFDRVDRRFVKIDGQFANVNEQLVRADEQFAKLDERFAKVDERFVQIDERFNKVDGRFDKLERRFDEIGKEMRHSASRIEYLIGLVVRDDLKTPPAGPAFTSIG